MCELRRNDYFGELAIVSSKSGGRRKHSTRAGTICELLRLGKARLDVARAEGAGFVRDDGRMRRHTRRDEPGRSGARHWSPCHCPARASDSTITLGPLHFELTQRGEEDVAF